ncbi:MAG: GMC family oxidoreductase N-terminal domain-containing protein [Candidatus Dormibacteraeota bacterium]|nr:GMC family oxidoreductase N-terminal domain-containing protein [Candidatus Dormibacteraeota bacterium]
MSSGTFLSPAEVNTLEAVCDTLVPSTPPSAGAEDLGGLLARSASDLDVARQFAIALAPEPPETRARFRQLLGLMGNPVFGLLLTGRPRGFAQLPPAVRERALQRMAESPLPFLRQAFQALKRPVMFIFYSVASGDVLPQGAKSGGASSQRAPVAGNPSWAAIGYAAGRLPASNNAVPKPIRTLSVRSDVELTADAVVIGSGAGGAVVAAELAAAGSDVVVLEMGDYLNEEDFTGNEAEMTPRLFLGHGLLATSDFGITVLAGSCLGGGTVVNWSDSLRTPPVVLEEWEGRHGVEGVAGPDYQRGFDVAERRMDVSTRDSIPNENNAALKRGCEALGYHWDYIPRNASGCEQRCGACQYGCPFGCKRSSLLTFLQDAHDSGARVITGCRVTRVLVSHGRAHGVEGWAAGGRHRVVVRAPIVVVAGGSIESPALLLRSGLDNPNIGRHLHLHPVAVVAGFYDHPIRAWAGSPQTIKTDEFAHLRGAYGFRIEVAPALPGTIASGTAWEGGRQHKLQMLRSANAAIFFVLTRDIGEGSVQVDGRGLPVIRYWPNRVDSGFLVRGMQEITRIALAGGAVAVSTTHTPPLRLESDAGRPGAVGAQRLAEFLAQIDRHGISPNRLPLFTAHQMGTCRLGADASSSVADPYGQVHGVRGLFVADASGFPTASGVNPMLSVMALAYRVAQRIKAG